MTRLLFLFLLLIGSSASAAPTLAVFDLSNHTDDPSLDPAGPGVAGLLVARFVGLDSIRVVERQDLRRVLDELDLNQSDAVDDASAIRAGRLLGARYIVMGELFSLQLPTLSVTLRIVDSEDGSVVAAKTVVGEIGDDGEEFFVLIEELAQEIITALDVEISAAERIEMSQVDVRELQAVIAYGRSLDRLPGEQPKALWRDKTRDMMPEPTRLQWTVHNNEGTLFPTIPFARAVGDEATAQLLETELAAAERRVKLGGTLVISGLAVGTAVALIAPFARNENGRPPGWPVIVGSIIGVGGIVAGRTAAGDQRTIRWKVAYPGHAYSIDIADELIERHNSDL